MQHFRVFASGVACAGALVGSVVLGHAAELTLKWKDNANNESGFLIERKAAHCRDTKAPWQTVATLPANTVNYVDENVTPGTTYCYRVHSFNAGGASMWSNQAEGVAKERKDRPGAQAKR